MKTLPDTVNHYKSTPEFNEHSVPAALQRQHTTAEAVWGRIRILEGKLLYRILEPAVEVITLTPELYGVVEPQVPHEVQLIGPVRFCVDFLR
ncbi:DUF1971 domain-containing protein [Undibacterium sp. TJN25]|uniref:DUF1971 domain-containing protein n=1 Tax=Undibacterium sp. TJN25 TaxID=3413056 RepID=UPI003BF0CB54